MDFDFLNRSFLESARQVIGVFRTAIEATRPPDVDLDALCGGIRHYGHCSRLDQDFTVAGVDGSGEFPILQQDDVFVHFAVSAGTCFRTESGRQHKMATIAPGDGLFAGFAVIPNGKEAMQVEYDRYLRRLTELDLPALVVGSDYCKVFSTGRRRIGPGDVTWDGFAFAMAEEVGTHGYLIRSIAELGMAIRMLKHRPKYLLIDTSLVYFLLGEALYLPELLKRYLICAANKQGTCVVGLNKSHNIPNGDLIGSWAREKLGLAHHWYLRLPSKALGEKPLPFLADREVPPRLGVSYLFKFHGTSFPMRIDVDAGWWKKSVGGDAGLEVAFFRELDYTCHDIRSYGYPYPLHAAHRASSLTRQERKAVKDVLLQQAAGAGVLRGAFLRNAEEVHMQGI